MRILVFWTDGRVSLHFHSTLMNYLPLSFERQSMRLMRRFGVGEKPECPYECKECKSSFSVQYQVCPECGGYSVERDEWG